MPIVIVTLFYAVNNVHCILVASLAFNTGTISPAQWERVEGKGKMNKINKIKSIVI